MIRLGKRTKRDDTDAPRRRQNGGDERRETVRSAEELARSQYTFRRNRTLTGSSSANVTSSNELNAEIKSPRAHAHHLLSLRRRLLLYFSITIIASLSFYLVISQLTASTVVQIATVPPSKVDQTAYRSAFETYYGARPVERLRFLLNEEALLSHLQSSHPEFKDVELEAGSRLGETVALVRARDAIARWSIGGKDSFVDAEGVVFEKDYGQSPTIRIVDNSGIRVASDGTVASNRFLGFVGRIISEAKQRNMTVNKVTIPALTTRQVRVNVKGQKTAYVVSIDRTAGEQAEDMQRASRYMKQRGLNPAYVDIRVAGKAFYR